VAGGDGGLQGVGTVRAAEPLGAVQGGQAAADGQHEDELGQPGQPGSRAGITR